MDENFCKSCQTIALPALNKLFVISKTTKSVRAKQQQRIKVGNVVSAVQSRDDCRFCRFLIDCLNLHAPDNSYRIYGNKDGSDVNPAKYDIYLVSDREPWYQKAGLDTNVPPCPFVWLRFGREPDQPLICISFEPRSATMSVSERLPGRVYPPERPALEAFNGSFDVQRVLSWLEKCDHQHDKCRNQPEQRLMHLLVIDVQTNAITRYKANTRFIALSYVWGRGSEAQLSYIKGWMTPNRFRDCYEGHDQQLPVAIPQTIQDAIIVTRKLGQRFLWVDLFCINQSPGPQKQAEIEQMDTVFASAWLTLVCVDGPNAEYGLTGASRFLLQTAQPKVRVPMGRLMATYIHSHWDNNGSSEWDSRAWCLQESLLSKRCLMFADKYVAMRCREELFHSLVDINIGDSTERVYHGDTYFREDGSSVDVDLTDWSFDNYGNFVSIFTGRQITDQADMYNACRGALKQIRAKAGVRFDFGIPDQDTLSALLWLPHHEHVLKRRHGFPTWSWLGWTGRIEYSYWTHNLYFECPHPRPNSRRSEIFERDFLNSHVQSATIVPSFWGTSNLNPQRTTINSDANHINKHHRESPVLHLKTTTCKIKVKLLRRAGTIDRPFPNKPPEEARGDHWAILATDNESTLLNEIGEHQIFDTSTISFRIGEQESRTLEERDCQVTAVFILYWPYLWDAKKVLTHFVSALLVVPDDGDGEIDGVATHAAADGDDGDGGDVVYNRVASVIVPASEWLKYELKTERNVFII